MATSSTSSDVKVDRPTRSPYRIEFAKTGRSKCKTCRQLIPQFALRGGIFILKGGQPINEWYHLECFRFPKVVENEPEALDGWKALTSEAQQRVRQAHQKRKAQVLAKSAEKSRKKRKRKPKVVAEASKGKD